jgi:hypothetical protein
VSAPFRFDQPFSGEGKQKGLRFRLTLDFDKYSFVASLFLSFTGPLERKEKKRSKTN